MKKLALALAATAAFAGPAIAADMPARVTKAPPPVMAPVANWTGCYVGGGIGYGLYNQESTQYDATVNPRVLLAPQQTLGGRGWFGTVQGGCDYQFGGTWVVGAFADYDFSDIHGQFGQIFNNRSGTEKLSSTWAVGGRIGWLVSPNLLTYFSGGYTESTFDRVNLANIGLVADQYIPGQTYSGYFIGSGIEYAVGFMPGLYVKTEYRFSDFNAATITGRSIATNAVIDEYDVHKYTHTVRTTLSYKFNFGGGAVVAKY